MCRTVVYHCETPVAESQRPSNPRPQAGRRDRSKPSADGASSVSHLSPASKEEVECALELGLALAPITDARRRLRFWRGPAGRVLGLNRCNLSPSIPSVSTSVVDPALSSCPRSFLIHTLGRCCGATSSPSLHPATNPDIKKPHQTPSSCCLESSPQKKKPNIKSKKFRVQSQK